MSKSFNNIRVGKKFRLKNYGEVWSFEVIEIMGNGDCKLKDLNTLEPYWLFDLTKYGNGEDFDLMEI